MEPENPEYRPPRGGVGLLNAAGLRGCSHHVWCKENDEWKNLFLNDCSFLRGLVPLWLNSKPRRIDARQGEFE